MDTAWYAGFGYRYRVSSPSATARRLLLRLYAPFRTDAGSETVDHFHVEPPAAGRGLWRLRLGESWLGEEESLGLILQRLEYELCLRTMAHRPDLLALHGATVFTDGGRGAAIISGFSGSGKTTLTLALAARGYRVGGDDIALIDPRTHQLWPMPRCFHLDNHTWSLVRGEGLHIPAEAVRHRFLTPADLGEVELHAAPVRHVLLTERGPDPVPRVTPLPLAAVALALLPQLECATANPATAVAALTPLLKEASGYRLISGDLTATVDLVASLLVPPEEL